MKDDDKQQKMEQKLQVPKRNNKGYDPVKKEWWGFYKRGSPIFLYQFELMDGRKKVLAGKMYSPIYDNGSVRHFFDWYKNGSTVDWVSRFNEVFETDFDSMRSVKAHIKDLNGTFGQFVFFYASKFMPEVKNFRIINHEEFPIRRKKGTRKFWEK